jgi:general secretion pathway protein E
MPPSTYASTGCDECRHTGFRGRIGIFEIMTMDDALREQITPPADATRLRELAISLGMRPLRIGGAEKVAMGLTTAAEVFGAVPSDEG